MITEFSRVFVSQGSNSYLDFLNASLEKHSKEWTYLCYKTDDQANEYFFKKLEELQSMLQEKKEEPITEIKIDVTPKIISLTSEQN